jgi:hypothetical protein
VELKAESVAAQANYDKLTGLVLAENGDILNSPSVRRAKIRVRAASEAIARAKIGKYVFLK